MKRPPIEETAGTDMLADEAGTRAMVDLMLGTTALLLVVLLAVGAQTVRHTASLDTARAPTPSLLDALSAGADGPVIFAGAGGIFLAGSDRIIAVGEISGSDRLAELERTGTPTLLISPDGLEAAFHATARLAALGFAGIRRVRLEGRCGAIVTIEIRKSGWNISCRRG